MSNVGGSKAPLQNAANAFISPETALTFPVASGGISLAWQLSAKLYPPLGQNAWVPVILAIIVGVLLFFASEQRGTTKAAKIGLLLAAFFNTVTLAAAAIGVSAATNVATPAVSTATIPSAANVVPAPVNKP
jgi:hypothetical protein